MKAPYDLLRLSARELKRGIDDYPPRLRLISRSLTAPEWQYILTAVVRVRIPGNLILVRLIAIDRPALSSPASKQLKIGPRTAGLNDVVELARLSTVLLLLRSDDVHLPPSGSKCPNRSTHSKQHHLSRIPEVEANASSIWPSVFAYLVPDDIGLVLESPRIHDL